MGKKIPNWNKKRKKKLKEREKKKIPHFMFEIIYYNFKSNKWSTWVSDV